MTHKSLGKRLSTSCALALLVAGMLMVFAPNAFAGFANGGFESGSLSGWTVTSYLNGGLTGSAPFTGASINPQWGGTTAKTMVLGPYTAMSQSDPNTGGGLQYPLSGRYCAVVNFEGAYMNANTLSQQARVAASDVDPADNDVHINFAWAAVVQNPDHTAVEQPYVYVAVKDVTKDTLLHESFIVAGAGTIWQDGPTTKDAQGNDSSTQYTDWQLLDIPCTSSQVAVGDTLEIDVTAAGCSLGGHWGYVYLDDFGCYFPVTPQVTAADKVYDGTTDATITGRTLTGVAPGDDVSLTGGTASFDTPDVGNGKTVTVTGLSLTGADAGKYVLTSTTSTTTANVVAAAPTVTTTTTKLSSDTKTSTYGQKVTFTAAVSPATATGTVQVLDGTTSLGSATLSGGSCSISTSTLTAATHSITAVYAGDSGDATSTSAALSQVVNKAPLIITAVPDSKTYDGTTSSLVTPKVSGLQGSDTVTGLTQAFTSADAMGNDDSTLQVNTSYTVNDGDLGNNYFVTVKSASGTISPATLTVTPDAQNLTYGDAVPTYTCRVTGFVNGEDATTAAGYTAPSCTSAYTPTTSVSASPLTITASGGSADNYSFDTTATANLTINQATLTVTATNASRNYGDTDPTPAFTVTGFVSSDTWTTAPTGAIAKPDRNVGSYAITFSGGNAGGNYTVSYIAGTLTVKPRPITVTAVADSKTYDGTTSSKGTPTITSGTLASGDAATWTQSFASKNVGTGLTFIPTGSVSDGNGGANYAVTFVNNTTGQINPASLTATAPSLTVHFGDPVPSYSCTVTGFVPNENAGNVLNYKAPTCSCSYTPTTPVSASPLTITCSGGSATDYSFSYKTGTLTITRAPTSVALSVTPAQYSDVSTFTATVSPATAGGSQLSGTVQFAVNGTNVGKAVATNSSGVASYSYTVTSPQGSYPVTATFTSTNTNFASPAAATSQTLVVSPEDASITYSGDTSGVAGSTLNLQATVMDSAAAGYAGLNPETSAKTIGDITKMWIAFVITPVGGTTATTVYAPVLDTGTVGDGIGTSAATFKASSEGSYTVVAQLVAGATGGTNQYYTAPDAEPATLNFYTNSGEFVIGGGWVTDSASASHGNFGMVARYSSAGKPQGLFAYVWSGSYNGVPAFFTITSNTLTALSFTGSKYPLSATLSGTATLQVNKASNWALLYGPETKLPFTVTAYDTGQSSGIGVDKLSLTLTGSKAPFLAGGVKSFSGYLLKGGNIVIHLK